MKIIYKAEDGTEFDKESNCKDYEIACRETHAALDSCKELENQRERDALLELASDYNSSFDCCTVTPLECFNFIIENIQKINEILGEYDNNIVFTDEFGEDYITAPERDGCVGCAFRSNTKECGNSTNVHHCGENYIIWIKK